jgi:chemotaxis protein MotB
VRPDPQTGVAGPSFLEEDSNGWLVTFSDLVLQLFAFVLVAAVVGGRAAAVPVANVEPVAEVAAPVAAMPAPTGAVAVRVPSEPDALSLARFDDLPPRVPARAAEAAASPAPAIAAARAADPIEEPRAPVASAPATSLAAELESFVHAEGLEEVVQVAVAGGGVTLSISDTIGFASGSADLLLDAAPVLAEVRELVAARPDLVVEVAGHTDDRVVHGGVFHSNLELSLARAARVARELAAGDDDLTGRIFAAGYGAQRPVASNDDDEGRARNRRVELRLVPGHDTAGTAAPVRAQRLAAR